MKIDSICIVGGGSAGWMTAATFIRLFPNKQITVLDTEDVPSIGVGESTTQFFREWLNYIDLVDGEWMDACDATYKYSCLLYTSPSPRDKRQSRMPSSA